MMLSTVSSNGLGEGADGFCANRNCGASKDRTQRARPAYRRCLGFMVAGFSECVTKAFYRRGRTGFRRGRRELPLRTFAITSPPSAVRKHPRQAVVARTKESWAGFLRSQRLTYIFPAFMSATRFSK